MIAIKSIEYFTTTTSSSNDNYDDDCTVVNSIDKARLAFKEIESTIGSPFTNTDGRCSDMKILKKVLKCLETSLSFPNNNK